MEFLSSLVGGGGEPAAQVSSGETIERLVERVQHSTLLEDRRDACRALKAMSKKYRLEVGAQGLPALVSVLRTDGSDTEIIAYALDTLCNVCSPEDWEDEVVEEDREDLTGVGEGFSEMFLKERDNIGLVLQYVEEFDFKMRRPAVQLLSDLLTNCARDVQQQILDSHVGVSRLMDVLGETREVLRNDALILLFKVTKGPERFLLLIPLGDERKRKSAEDRCFRKCIRQAVRDNGGGGLDRRRHRGGGLPQAPPQPAEEQPEQPDLLQGGQLHPPH
jgi:hypothetical protein